MAGEIASAFVRVRPDTSGFKGDLERGVTGAFGGLGGIIAKGVAGGVGAVGLLGVMSARAAIQFESSFAGIRKTVDATEPQFEALQKGIRNMAKEIPAGVNQLNAIGESAGQLGIQRKAILPFIRTIADLGETTNLTGEMAASTMARIVNVMQLPQSKIRNLGSAIVALGNAGASTESEIADFALRIAGAGKIAGLTAGEVLAIGNAFSSIGIEAEAGGTAISKVLLNMNSAALSGGKQLQGFAEIAGMTGVQFQKAFRDDAAGTFTTFVEGLDRITQRGGDASKALAELGLTDARLNRAFLGAAGSGDILRQSIELGNRAWKENTALTIEAEKRYETTGAQLQMLRNRWTDLRITIGEKMLPVINDAIKGIVRLAERVGAAATVRAKLNVIWDAVQVTGEGLLEKLKEAARDVWFGEDREVTILSPDPLFVTFPSVVVTRREGGLGEELKEFGRGLWDSAMEGSTEGSDKFWAKVGNEIKGFPAQAARDFRAALNMNDISADFDKWIMGPLRAAAGNISIPGRQIATNLIAGIRGGLTALSGVIPTSVTGVLMVALRGALGPVGNAALAIGSRIVSAVRGALGPIVGAVLGRLNGIITAIANTAVNAFSAAVGIGWSIIQGVLSGLVGLGKAVAGKIADGIRWGIDKGGDTVGSTAHDYAKWKLGQPIAEGVIAGWVLGTRDLPTKMSDVLRKSIDRAIAVVEGARGRFATAFDAMQDRILRAFDAQTSGHMTATEQLLAEQDARRRMEDLVQRQTDAQTRLNEAIATGDAAAIAAAQRELDRATEDVARPALEEQAAQERIQYESSREELRLALEGRLEVLQKHWAKVGVKSKTALNALNALLMKVGLTSFTDTGQQLGNAFVKALAKAIRDAVKKGGTISSAIDAALVSVTTGVLPPITAPALPPGAGANPILPALATMNETLGDILTEAQAQTAAAENPVPVTVTGPAGAFRDPDEIAAGAPR